ncbi:hypothetical protein ACFLRF_05630 [Candidatus Altiarchaeota archaeon]
MSKTRARPKGAHQGRDHDLGHHPPQQVVVDESIRAKLQFQPESLKQLTKKKKDH